MSDPTPAIAPSYETIEFDLDDDLFDFDALVERAQVAPESAREPASPEPVPPVAAASAAPAAPLVPAHAPSPVAPRTAAAAPIAQTIVPPPPRSRFADGAAARRAFGQVRASPKLVIALLVSIAFSFLFTGVTWRSVRTLDTKVSEVRRIAEHPVADPTPVAPTSSPTDPAFSLIAPHATDVVVPDLYTAKAAAAIDVLQGELARGDHAGARERLFAVLALIDRPATEGSAASDVIRDRAALVARASLLIADSYRLQADALQAEQIAVLAPPRATGEEEKQ